MWTPVTSFFTSVVAVSAAVITMQSASDNYVQERTILLSQENSTFFGHGVVLGRKEVKVNEILLQAKRAELTSAYHNSSDFLPSVHFFQAKERIDKSALLRIIRRLPKGACLHTHLLAAASVDFVIANFTYRDNLYGAVVNDVFKLRFMEGPNQGNWIAVKDLRARDGAAVFDEWLRNQLVLNVGNPAVEYPNPETIWAKFKKTFTTGYDMFSYRPVFQEYLYRLLQELYDDNVMYTELKGTIMPLYELDGTDYTREQFFEFFKETVTKFKSEHPGYVGARYIHSIYRGVELNVLESGLEDIIKLKELFPDVIAGFDFVGYEEEGKTLFDYHSVLLEKQPQLKFFFHAGETNWFGHTDLNLADALLLNASRIGHGFAITKHPKLLQLGKERSVPLEICPISNQVLKLNEDPRNHPGAVLMAQDYPVVVGNDDPSAWNATGLSYDWYILFMAMTPEDSGLEVLKQLAINSIVYSSMEDEEKKGAMAEWEQQWEEFLDEIIQEQRK